MRRTVIEGLLLVDIVARCLTTPCVVLYSTKPDHFAWKNPENYSTSDLPHVCQYPQWWWYVDREQSLSIHLE